MEGQEREHCIVGNHKNNNVYILFCTAYCKNTISGISFMLALSPC